MKLSEFLNKKTPFSLFDKDGNRIYYEDSDGFWIKRNMIKMEIKSIVKIVGMV